MGESLCPISYPRSRLEEHAMEIEGTTCLVEVNAWVLGRERKNSEVVKTLSSET